MHDETWAAAVRYAVDQGTDVINMSFGNDGGVAVGAIDKDGNRWKYSLSRGSSDAAAYVSVTAALIRSKYPDLTAGQVINRLIRSSFVDTSGFSRGRKRSSRGSGAGSTDLPAGRIGVHQQRR
ncbi:S8 family serine peptidase [Streptomyces chartreusis]